MRAGGRRGGVRKNARVFFVAKTLGLGLTESGLKRPLQNDFFLGMRLRCRQRGAQQLGDGGVAIGRGVGEGGGAVVGR